MNGISSPAAGPSPAAPPEYNSLQYVTGSQPAQDIRVIHEPSDRGRRVPRHTKKNPSLTDDEAIRQAADATGNPRVAAWLAAITGPASETARNDRPSEGRAGS